MRRGPTSLRWPAAPPRRLLGALASAGAALTFAGAATGVPVIGAAEDGTKYAADGGAALFGTMSSFGLTSNRVSVYWNFNEPATIQDAMSPWVSAPRTVQSAELPAGALTAM